MILRVLWLSGDIYAVPSWNRIYSQKSGMECLSCWRDDQHLVAQNDFGQGRTVVLDEVHHRAEVSAQRSTAAWSSSSYLRNCAFPGVQEENSREGSCNLGCYGRACRPWTAFCPWRAWEKAVVSPDCSQMHWFLHVQVWEMCRVPNLLYPDPRRSLSWTRSEFPQTCLPKTRWKKGRRVVVQMSLL